MAITIYKKQSNRLLELDAMRGIAAMFVVCFHLGMNYPTESHKLLHFGLTGVDLFFIISGFVILLTLEKTSNWKSFVINRFSRLYPVYWFCVTFTAILMFIRGRAIPEFAKDNLPIEYLVNLSMFQTWLNIPDLDGSYWTLSVELIFYAFMLIIFCLKQLKHIQLIGAIALIPVIIFRSIGAPTSISHVLPIANFYPLFYAGILFYKMKFESITIARFVLAIGCFIIQYSLFNTTLRSAAISAEQYGVMLGLYCCTFLLYTNNYLRFIIHPATIFLGNISYSLYLVHQFMCANVIVPGLMRYAHMNFWIAAFGVALPIALIVATLIHKFVEKPAMNLIRSIGLRSREI
jgi:peptidoglycan/LPS O-acetylase OafA/YrhL